jgi:hypothetical protein
MNLFKRLFKKLGEESIPGGDPPQSPLKRGTLCLVLHLEIENVDTLSTSL